MANGADLAYLRRQRASKEANQASGVQPLNQGQDALNGNYWLNESQTISNPQYAQQQEQNDPNQDQNFWQRASNFFSVAQDSTVRGVANFFDNFWDTALWFVGGISGGWWGQENDVTRWTQEASDFNWQDYLVKGANILAMPTQGLLNANQYNEDFWTKWSPEDLARQRARQEVITGTDFDKYYEKGGEVVGEIAANIVAAGGVGKALSTLTKSQKAIKAGQLAARTAGGIASGIGSGFEQASAEGASFQGASNYALLKGAISGVTTAATYGLGMKGYGPYAKGSTVFGNMVFEKGASGGVAKAVDILTRAGGNALVTAAETAADPILKQITYNANAMQEAYGTDEARANTFKNIAISAATSFATSTLIQAVPAAIKRAKLGKQGYTLDYAEQQIQAHQEKASKYMDKWANAKTEKEALKYMELAAKEWKAATKYDAEIQQLAQDAEWDNGKFVGFKEGSRFANDLKANQATGELVKQGNKILSANEFLTMKGKAAYLYRAYKNNMAGTAGDADIAKLGYSFSEPREDGSFTATDKKTGRRYAISIYGEIAAYEPKNLTSGINNLLTNDSLPTDVLGVKGDGGVTFLLPKSVAENAVDDNVDSLAIVEALKTVSPETLGKVDINGLTITFARSQDKSFYVRDIAPSKCYDTDKYNYKSLSKKQQRKLGLVVASSFEYKKSPEKNFLRPQESDIPYFISVPTYLPEDENKFFRVLIETKNEGLASEHRIVAKKPFFANQLSSLNRKDIEQYVSKHYNPDFEAIPESLIHESYDYLYQSIDENDWTYFSLCLEDLTQTTGQDLIFSLGYDAMIDDSRSEAYIRRKNIAIAKFGDFYEPTKNAKNGDLLPVGRNAGDDTGGESRANAKGDGSKAKNLFGKQFQRLQRLRYSSKKAFVPFTDDEGNEYLELDRKYYTNEMKQKAEEAEKLGYSIHFLDLTDSHYEDDPEGFSEGWIGACDYERSRVLVKIFSSAPYQLIAEHELTHVKLRKLNRKEYKKVAQKAFDFAGDDAQAESIFQKYKDLYDGRYSWDRHGQAYIEEAICQLISGAELLTSPRGISLRNELLDIINQYSYGKTGIVNKHGYAIDEWWKVESIEEYDDIGSNSDFLIDDSKSYYAVSKKEEPKQADEIPIEPKDKGYELPKEYVKDIANANNIAVYSYKSVLDSMKDVRSYMAEISGLDPKDTRITFSNESMVKSAESLFRLLNKKGVSAEEVQEGIYKLFDGVELIAKNGDKLLASDILNDPENQALRDAVNAVVADSMKKLVTGGTPSLPSKLAAQKEAFKQVYDTMKKELMDYAREMRDRIAPSRTLRDLKIHIPKWLRSGVEFDKDLAVAEMASMIANPFLQLTSNKIGYSPRLHNGKVFKPELRSIIDNYKAAYEGTNTPVFPYDQDLVDMMESLYNDLPEPTVLKNGSFRWPSLTASQIKQANNILRTVYGLAKKAHADFHKEILPASYEAREAFAVANADKISKLATFNPYTFNTASQFAIINGTLGHSGLAYEVTVRADQKTMEAVAYEAEKKKFISNYLSENKLDDGKLWSVTEYRGAKVTWDSLVDLYASLISSNFAAIDKNGLVARDDKKGVSHILKSGEAQSALDELEELLPPKYKEYAHWLIEDFYGKNLGSDYVQYKRDEGFHDFAFVKNFYPRKADYVEMSNVETAVKGPKLFVTDMERVNHNHEFLMLDATGRALSYISDMAMGTIRLPQYRKERMIINAKGSDGRSLYQDIYDNNPKAAKNLETTIGHSIGIDPVGREKRNKVVSFLTSNYYKVTLGMNIFGTAPRQTLSGLMSNFRLSKVFQGVLTRIFGSKAFKDEYHYLATNLAAMAYRSSGSSDFKVDMSRGFGKAVTLLRKASDLGMKPIALSDKGTVGWAGLATAMVYANDAGYVYGTPEYREFVCDVFSEFIETQIGHLATNQSRLSRGDSGFGVIGEIASVLQGPQRAAEGAFIDKFNLWRRCRGLTDEKVEQAIEEAKREEANATSVRQEAEEFEQAAKELLQEAIEDKTTKGEEKAEKVRQAREDYNKMRDKADKARDQEAKAKGKTKGAEQQKKNWERYKRAGGKMWFISSLAGLGIAAFLNALINDLNKKARGKKDWGDFDWETIRDDTFTYAAVGWLPVGSTIVNAYKGYDTTYPTGQVFKTAFDFVSAFVSAVQNNDEKSWKTLLRDSFGFAEILTGIPISNTYKLIYGAIKTFSPNAADIMNGLFYANKADNAKIISAIEKGQDDMALRYIDKAVTENCGIVSDGVRGEYKNLIKDGQNPIPSAIPNKYTNQNGEEVTITWTQQQKAKAIYAKANKEIEKIIASKYYKALTSAQKASLIRAVYSAYRTAGVYAAVPKYDGTNNRYAILAKAGGKNVGTIMLAVRYISTLEDTKRKTRKEQAVAYVNQLPLSKNEKLLVLKMAGFSVDENKVKSALRMNGLNEKEIAAFLG